MSGSLTTQPTTSDTGVLRYQLTGTGTGNDGHLIPAAVLVDPTGTPYAPTAAGGTQSTSQSAQGYHTATLASALTGTGAQTAVDLGGYNGAIMLECMAVGTVVAQAATYKIQGSYDNVNFYDCGYQQVDAVASPARSVSGFTQTPGNGTVRNVLQVLDVYRYYRINVSANTLGTGLTISAFAIPVG